MRFQQIVQLLQDKAQAALADTEASARFRAAAFNRAARVIANTHAMDDRVSAKAIAALPLSDNMKDTLTRFATKAAARPAARPAGGHESEGSHDQAHVLAGRRPLLPVTGGG